MPLNNQPEATFKIRAQNKTQEAFSQVKKGLNDLGKTGDKVGKRFQKIGNSINSFGKSFTAKASVPAGIFGALTLKAAGDFEAKMNQVRVVSEASEEQFKKLRKQAKDLGSTTQFTATQVADAQNFLAMAGFDANKVFAAIPETLKLASSAQIDLGRSADIVTNILTGFRKDIRFLAPAVDSLVSSFTGANTNLEQLGDAMSFASPVAAAAGTDFRETTTAISLMGNAGLQAERAGAALRTGIIRILAPTKAARETLQRWGVELTDSKGRLVSLFELVKRLEPFKDDIGGISTIVDKRSAVAFAGLLGQGSEKFKKFNDRLKDSDGRAAEVAAVQMKGFNGALREFKSALEGAQLAIADSGLLKFATDLVKDIAGLFRQLTKVNPTILKWGTIIGGAAIAIGPLAIALGATITALGTIGSSMTALIAATGPIGLFIAAAVAIVAAWKIWGDDIKNIVRITVEVIKTWLVDKFNAIVDGIKEKLNKITGFFTDLYDKVVGNSIIPDLVDDVGAEFNRLDTVMVQPVMAAKDTMVSAFESFASNAGNAIKGFIKTGKVELKSFEGVVDSFVDNALSQLINLSIGSFGNGENSGSGLLGIFGQLATSLFLPTLPPTIPGVTPRAGFLGPGFASGGSFIAGGTGGTDQNIASFPVTRGERITVEPLGRQGGNGIQFNVFISNNSNANVQAEQRPNGQGGMDLEIMIDQTVAKKIRQGGATRNELLTQFGLSPAVQRG